MQICLSDTHLFLYYTRDPIFVFIYISLLYVRVYLCKMRMQLTQLNPEGSIRGSKFDRLKQRRFGPVVGPASSFVAALGPFPGILSVHG